MLSASFDWATATVERPGMNPTTAATTISDVLLIMGRFLRKVLLNCTSARADRGRGRHYRLPHLGPRRSPVPPRPQMGRAGAETLSSLDLSVGPSRLTRE